MNNIEVAGSVCQSSRTALYRPPGSGGGGRERSGSKMGQTLELNNQYQKSCSQTSLIFSSFDFLV